MTYVPRLSLQPRAIVSLSSLGLFSSSIEEFRVALEHAGPPTLADGTVGYFVRYPREDDCFAAALATTLQVPIGDVPDPRIDERLNGGWTPERVRRTMMSELDRWLRRRCLRIILHRNVPARRRRWIGVIDPPDYPGYFQRHCIVMSHDRFLFDPAAFGDHISPNSLPRVRHFQPKDITYGLSFLRHPAQTGQTP